MTFTIPMFWIGVICGAVGIVVILWVAGQTFYPKDDKHPFDGG